MGRKPHVPIELPFFFGKDEWKFTEISTTSRILYVGCWSVLWFKKDQIGLSMKEINEVADDVKISRRYVQRHIDVFVDKGFVKKVNDVYFFKKIREKRNFAFGRAKGETKTPPKQKSKEPGGNHIDPKIKKLYELFKTKSNMNRKEKVIQTFKEWMNDFGHSEMEIETWIHAAPKMCWVSDIYPKRGGKDGKSGTNRRFKNADSQKGKFDEIERRTTDV